MGLTHLLDTNTGIYVIDGRLAAPLPSGSYGASVVTEIEMLSKPGTTAQDMATIRAFIAKLILVDSPSRDPGGGRALASRRAFEAPGRDHRRHRSNRRSHAGDERSWTASSPGADDPCTWTQALSYRYPGGGGLWKMLLNSSDTDESKNRTVRQQPLRCIPIALRYSTEARVLRIPTPEILGRRPARVGRHEVGSLEGNDLFRRLGRRLDLVAKPSPIGGRKLDRHVPVEGLDVRPEGHPVRVPEVADAAQEARKLRVVDLPVLERAHVERAASWPRRRATSGRTTRRGSSRPRRRTASRPAGRARPARAPSFASRHAPPISLNSSTMFASLRLVSWHRYQPLNEAWWP